MSAIVSSVEKLSSTKDLHDYFFPMLGEIAERKNRSNSRELKALDDSSPWWLEEKASASSQVDLIVNEAWNRLDLIEDTIDRDLIKEVVRTVSRTLSTQFRFSPREVEKANQELFQFFFSKGPIEPLFSDPSVTDIYIDTHDQIRCLRRGQALETPFKFRGKQEYDRFLTQMLNAAGKSLSHENPIVDCVTDDMWRTRVNAIHPSLLDSDEPAVVIRIPRMRKVSFHDLLRTRTMPPSVAVWLSELIGSGEANILVMGSTGSGKTTLTSALLSGINANERICTIEDVPEIFIPARQIEKLVSRPASDEGFRSIEIATLLRAALRRSPHRIVIGEIRDIEGLFFLKALETGHAGSVATIHANSPKEALWRLVDLVTSTERGSEKSLVRRISRSIQILLHVKEVKGVPCLTEIVELHPSYEGEFETRTLVSFVGEVEGKRHWNLLEQDSEWIQRLSEKGCLLSAGQYLTVPETFHEEVEEE